MNQVKVEFNYLGAKTSIFCYENDKMEEICKKFAGKSNTYLSDLVFLYSGTTLNLNLTFAQIANAEDRQRKVISVIVTDSNADPGPQHCFVKSTLPICPKCFGNVNLSMNDDYKFDISGCKNNHEIKGLFIDDYEKTQNIDLANIKCGKCDNCVSNTYNNEMYLCNKCNLYLCPLCKITHDNSHILINYNLKNYVCDIHTEIYSMYCSCGKNICTKCERDHANHPKKSYGIMFPDKNNLLNELKAYKSNIDLFNTEANNIIKKINYVQERINKVYNIYYEMVNNYEDKDRNYQIFTSLNNIKKDKLLNQLKIINQKKNDIDKMVDIMTIHKKLNYSNDISITYLNTNQGKIKIFDRNFVNNNKDKCKIIYEYDEYELRSEFDTRNLKNDKLEIKLFGVNSITNINKMFNECEELESVTNTINWDTSKITDMSFAFNGCSSLKSLPDINNWKTNNVEEMQSMFNKCQNLISLPDISNWNTSKVKNMSHMFSECSSLISLPDISKWNIEKVTSIKSMFEECGKLISLPDISKWNTENIIEISFLFKDCTSLLSLPDISKWNLNKLQAIHSLFSACEKLTSLPDISKWNTSKVANMSYIFNECTSLKSLPAINKWNTSNMTKVSNIFNECKELETIPDISQWNLNKVTDMSYIFNGCSSLKSLPDISKWNISNATEINSMFSRCLKLDSLPDISKWDTRNVVDMSFMFNACISLKSLPDINRWNIRNVKINEYMFFGCSQLTYIPDKFKE